MTCAWGRVLLALILVWPIASLVWPIASAAAAPVRPATDAPAVWTEHAHAPLAFAAIAPPRNNLRPPFVVRAPATPLRAASPVLEAALPAGVVLFGAGLAGLTVVRIAVPRRRAPDAD